MAARIVKASFVLGFEGLGRAVDPAGCGIVDSYPHYTIERWPATAEQPERLRLVLAVAGFKPDQVAVTLVDNHLLVRGDQKGDGEARVYIHRGIAGRRFQRLFRLAEDLRVLQADLAYGLLCIDLVRQTIETLSKSIKIETRDVPSVT